MKQAPTATTKAELERAEIERDNAKATLASLVSAKEVLTTVLPDAAKHYRKLVGDLGKTLETDVIAARQCLKTLLGDIRLVPASSGRFLEAELRHNPEGLIRLALNFGLNDKGPEDGPFKVGLVAGARYHRCLPLIRIEV